MKQRGDKNIKLQHIYTELSFERERERGVNLTYINISFCKLASCLSFNLIPYIDQWNLHAHHHEELFELWVILQLIFASLLRSEAIIDLFFLCRGCILTFSTRGTSIFLWLRCWWRGCLCDTRERHALGWWACGDWECFDSWNSNRWGYFWSIRGRRWNICFWHIALLGAAISRACFLHCLGSCGRSRRRRVIGMLQRILRACHYLRLRCLRGRHFG